MWGMMLCCAVRFPCHFLGVSDGDAPSKVCGPLKQPGVTVQGRQVHAECCNPCQAGRPAVRVAGSVSGLSRCEEAETTNSSTVAIELLLVVHTGIK